MATGWIVYTTSDNSINSVCNADPGAVPSGFAVLSVAFDPTSTPFGWNPVGPAAAVTAPITQITPLQFAQRFSAATYMALKASTDANVQFFLEQLALSTAVYPRDPTVQGGLAYLVGAGYLTQAEADIVGAG
jgi:hypothetical protein